MAEEKRPPAEKPLVVPLSFDGVLNMIAMGGKPEMKKRPKPIAKSKQKS